MTSLVAKAIKFFARRVIRKPVKNEQQLVRHLRRVFNHPPGLRLVPKGITIRQLKANGFVGDCVSSANPHCAILYIHGGAWIAGTPKTYHNFAARLAKQLNAAVYLPRYPFAPEYPYPAALNHIQQAYQFLLTQGFAADKIAIGGDSAGGGLSLGLLLRIREHQLPMPACALLISPGADATLSGASMRDNADSDDMLGPEMLQLVPEIYIPNQAQRREPCASPAFADYQNFPPLMITVDRTEALYSDALAVQAQAQAAKVPVTLLERSGLFHVWPIMVPLLPEANQDLKKIQQFFQTYLS